jgi:threonine synthase
MKYVSTRGSAPTLDFEAATLAGLASDGGLYVPQSWPSLSRDEIVALAGKSYVETAVTVMRPFVAGSLTEDELRELCTQAYGRFAHDAVVPLVQLDHQHWLLELFHGPTLAFKDVALQLLGLLFEKFLAQRQAIRVLPRLMAWRGAKRSTFSCSIPKAACRMCSGGR